MIKKSFAMSRVSSCSVKLGQALLAGLLLTGSVSAVAEADEPLAKPRLGDLKSFEVEQYTESFSHERDFIEPEYVQQLTTALEHERALPKASPADGVIRLRCVKGPECNDLKLSVTYGSDGPEVWSVTEKRYKFFTTWWFGNILKPSQTLTTEFIQQLAEAYRQDSPKNINNPVATTESK
jgi:hypothetical protein